LLPSRRCEKLPHAVAKPSTPATPLSAFRCRSHKPFLHEGLC
jgi:hypothetical protein